MQAKENAGTIFQLAKLILRPKTSEVSTQTEAISGSDTQCNLNQEFSNPDTKVLNIPMEHPERIIQPTAETTNTTSSWTQPDSATPSRAPLKKFLIKGLLPKMPVDMLKN